MEFSEIVGKAVIDMLIKQGFSIFAREKRTSINERIQNHIFEVENWAESFDFVGLGTPKVTKEDSVSLTLSTAPRRYRSLQMNSDAMGVEETKLLSGKGSIVLLGDPGSGKTTTLKRAALELLSGKPSGFNCPILLLLKEIEGGISPICEEIARKLGIKYEVVEEFVKEGIPTRKRITVGGMPLQDAVAVVLNNAKAVLLLDGLDELHPEIRQTVESEIGTLGRKLKNSKIVVSCRSGDFRRGFSGFSVYEIMPLDIVQIRSISTMWLEDSEGFLRNLETCPYKDIVDRPLLLTFLLFLFDAEGCLPEQPSAIYRKVVYRLLREWDEERSIQRRSNYARFDQDRKIDFLSELSYVLTCRIKGKVFSENELITAYKGVCESFALPESEHMTVVAELETHTGILIQAGFDKFQFSHLSLQEYFCANYLSRAPFVDLMAEYLNVNPAPIAVACAISADPGRFFTTLVEHPLTGQFLTSSTANSRHSMLSFLTRLRLENPIFKVSQPFGRSVLFVFSVFYGGPSSDIGTELTEFLSVRAVSESAVLALRSSKVSLSPLIEKNYVLVQLDPALLMTKAFASRLPVRLPRGWWKKYNNSVMNGET
jgi:hypothetical protein